MADSVIPATSVGSNPGKLPWKPRVAGINGLIFGPVAAGLVAYVNFRRMGQPRKAKQILVGWIPAIVVLAAILLFIPVQITHGAALGLGVGCMLAFTNLQKSDFALWEQSHPQTRPANGWNSLGLGLLGLVILVVLLEAVSLLLYLGMAWLYSRHPY